MSDWSLLEEGREARIVFSAELAETAAVAEALVQFLKRHNCPIDYFAFKLVTQEILVNAVVHGNKNDASKKVKVYVGFNEFRLAIEIMDEGTEKNKDQTTSANKTFTEGGRGFQLMQLYGYYVDILNGGSGFILTKRLGEKI